MLAELKPSEKVGLNLKRLIKESGRTQESFAVKANIDERTLRRWLQKGINSISSISKVAEVLGVDVEALLF